MVSSEQSSAPVEPVERPAQGLDEGEPQEESFDVETESSDRPSPEQQQAYEQVLAGSTVASKLASGQYSTLQFTRWRVVQDTPREIWIDLVANWSTGGPEVHFIWSYNKKNSLVRPLSQAARNLESNEAARR
jgi:hypothetical protein